MRRGALPCERRRSFRLQVVGGDAGVRPPRNLKGIVGRRSLGTRASRAPGPWLTLLAQGHYPAVFSESMATGVPVRFRNDKTESIPHICSISRVRATPAPTVCAACESVPVVIRRAAGLGIPSHDCGSGHAGLGPLANARCVDLERDAVPDHQAEKLHQPVPVPQRIVVAMGSRACSASGYRGDRSCRTSRSARRARPDRSTGTSRRRASCPRRIRGR